MHNLRKSLISAAVLAVVGLQVSTQVLDTGGTFWPFMPYHMYSNVYGEGAAIVFYELRLTAGTPDMLPTQFTFRDAGLPEYKFAGLLRATAARQGYLMGAGEDGAARYLARTISESRPYQSAQLWELRHEIGPDGLRSRIPEQVLVREWSAAAPPSP